MSFESVVEEVARVGRSTYGNWSESTYRSLADGPALELWRGLGAASPESCEAVRTYLKLGVDALSHGLLAPESAEPVGVLSKLWWKIIPRTAGSVPLAELPQQIVTSWNLGEGIRDEGLWLDLVVAHALSSKVTLGQVDAALEAAVDGVFAERSVPSWSGAKVSVVDCRPAVDDFLPGAMTVLAPAVLSVRDRRHRDVHVGIALQKEPVVLGRIPRAEPFEETRKAKPFSFGEWGQLVVGEETVYLSCFGEVDGSIGLGSGFIVLSARNSQRLWVVSYD